MLNLTSGNTGAVEPKGKEAAPLKFMKSSDPMRANARAEINIYDTLDAVEHFAANYPAERIDLRDANRLLRAAALIIRRAAHAQLQAILPRGSTVSMPETAPVLHNRLGRIPPTDPELQKLLDRIKIRAPWIPLHKPVGGCLSVSDPTGFVEDSETENHTIGWAERNADL